MLSASEDGQTCFKLCENVLPQIVTYTNSHKPDLNSGDEIPTWASVGFELIRYQQ